MQNEEIKSNSIVFAGPFMGEFGWELSHWVPHLRWLREQYRGKRLIVSSYPGREPLYNGIADDFWPLPDWFVDKKYDCDCFEALGNNNHYEELTLHFKNELTKRFLPENTQWTKAPRGFNHILRNTNQVAFQKLESSPEANKIADDLIAEHGGKPVIILFARNVNREMFLDIVNNKSAYVEDHYPGGLPTRNWPKSHWNSLFNMLHSQFGDQFTFAIGGTTDGNCLWEAVQINDDVIDLTEFDINQSLDVTIALLNKAFMSISSQSGPTHLSVQCGCPSFVYGHEQERHTKTDNPLRTDVVFLETQLGLYNDSPELLFKEISVYIDLLKQEGRLTNRDRINVSELTSMGDSIGTITSGTIPKIKKIGFVGVFDNPDSTNIPFAKAFQKLGHEISVFNYRTTAQEIGTYEMNIELEKFAGNFDLIIICKGNSIYPKTIRKCTEKTKVCFYMMDALCHLDNDPTYYDMARAADFSVVTAAEVGVCLKAAQVENVHHILQGINPLEFKPIKNEKICDIVFIGQATQKRLDILSELSSKNISGRAYGPGFPADSVSGEKFNQVCAEGRILLAINNTDSSEDSFSDRILRYMATGGCVVTEYSKGLEKYFVNGKHAAWPQEGETLIDVIQYLLVHPKMMNQIAENGHQYVLENHTWGNVAEKIIEITEGI